MEAKGAEIALSPGFRWGTSLLPGDAITLEQVMNLTAITYPDTVVSELTGAAIKSSMEDICDNLFHPDPYYQQGGDMVRVGGMSYSCTPGNRIGARIGDMRLRGKPIQADRVYKVASWAPVADGVSGEPVWEVLSRYLRDKKVIVPRRLELPRLIGTAGNLGSA
jgi:sulfur-oxidizing protein SoxB